MNQIKRKLHSNAGASIILVLALTLICVMVASVIIAAAASGAGRNEVELKKQQDYLAISSAAQYVADNLNAAGDFRFCGVYLNHVKPCNMYKNHMPTTVYLKTGNRRAYAIPTPYASLQGENLTTKDVLQFYLYIAPGADGNIFCGDSQEKKVLEEADGSATNFSGIFKDMLKAAVTDVYVNDVAYSRNFTILVEDDRIPDVNCTFEMDKRYQVTVTIKSAAPGSEYVVTVELPAFSPVIDPAGRRETETCMHKCFYEYCDENTGNVRATDVTESTFTHEVDNITTTVTWGTPSIHKEES